MHKVWKGIHSTKRLLETLLQLLAERESKIWLQVKTFDFC